MTESTGGTMNKKRVWRYYCQYCKKSGCSAGHTKHHEAHCTMNPNRKCGFCETVGNNTTDMVELLKALKADIIKFKSEQDGEFNKYKEESIGEDTWLSEIGYDIVLDNLREKCEGCPACMLAAIRQAKMNLNIQFNFKAEKENFWSCYNEIQRQDSDHGGLYQ